MDRIGLIAGGGEFPAIFAKNARAKGTKVIAFGVKGITSDDIEKQVDKIHWIDIDNFNIAGFVLLLFAERIKNMIMVGKIEKSWAFRISKKNKDFNEVLSSAKDNMDYSILAEITKRFNQIGVNIIDGLEFLKELVIQEGIYTKRYLSPEEKADLEFGLPIAKQIAALDIGQTITVKNKAVLTVEAIEGTDNTIRRAAEHIKGDYVVIKVARPRQDMRWDVPLIGLNTIHAMAECGARVLAVESGKMFFAEKDRTIEEADRRNLSIIAV